MQKHLGKRLSFVFRNFPLTQMHPMRSRRGNGGLAGPHGKFWEMHDLLYENQDRWTTSYWSTGPAAASCSREAGEALETKEFQARVKADFTSGVRSGVNGTPTFFINGQRHDGPYDLILWWMQLIRYWNKPSHFSASVCQPGFVHWPSCSTKTSVARPELTECLPFISVSTMYSLYKIATSPKR